ncbi:AAA family ATPase [Candidatus Poribacteria bacterium]|nr:AAA family ATPase [Candidatus Poribacteria bacterium]MXY29212.1 AAA family ATPase [Candidatus Poribacteria bacterium]MYK20117.1 AAA family ATPase [Candidatus Poribacteria bacterium]
MIINRLIAKNWRNFQQINVPLRERQFIVGPNASGKSNLLDIFRFLRDIVKVEGGGFQKAVKDRGGVSKIRCLSARQDSQVAIEIYIADTPDASATWRYSVGFCQADYGDCQSYLTHERVWKEEQLLLDRPDADDKEDPERLIQTALEQNAANAKFREIGRFLRNVTYHHLVPQLIRFADAIRGEVIEDDPFGQGFLERVAGVHPSTRRARLKRIEHTLKIAVPQFEKLEFIRDNKGRPHLQAHYSHWCSKEEGHHEDQFSDGVLRLIGLLWSLLESDSIILLEEPELSLNMGIVSKLAPSISRLQRSRGSQVLVSTQSDTLLIEPGIDGREVLLLTPTQAGTSIKVSSDIDDIRILLKNGFTVGEVVLPQTHPKHIGGLVLPE